MEQILDDWQSLCKFAFKEVNVAKGESKKTVWEQPKETAVPELLSLDPEEEYLVMRVIRNKVTREDHIDIRVFRKEKTTDEEERVKQQLIPTNKGMHMSVAQWKQHLPKLIKLLRKYE